MQFQSNEEKSLWTSVLVACFQGKPYTGGQAGYVESADAAVLAFRDRCQQRSTDPLVGQVRQWLTAHIFMGMQSEEPDVLAEKVIQATIQNPGKKIEAIKQVRTILNCNLKDGKELVEFIEELQKLVSR